MDFIVIRHALLGALFRAWANPYHRVLTFTCVALVYASACSSISIKKYRVELKSDPSGAEVLSQDGEKLGVTPLSLEEPLLSKAARDGRLKVTLSAPGFQQRELVMEIRGEDSYDVKLTRYEKQYFSERLLYDFPSETNEMTRELMQAQAWLYARKNVEAEKALETFQKKYPNIAAAYVLQASVESQKGNHDKARLYLLRARSIDPNDPVIARMLNKKTGGGQ